MTEREIECIERLLMADRTGRMGEALGADELLMVFGAAFEPIFHEPPIGPVPEYLAPHLAVHGCVAEYEEKYEELDRWKALQLSRWLLERAGRRWCVAGKTYVLQVESEDALACGKHLFTLTEVYAEYEEPAARKS